MKQLIIVAMLLSLLLACTPITPYPREQVQNTEPQVVPPTTEVIKAEMPKEEVVSVPVIETKPVPAESVAPVESAEESTLSPKEKCIASCESQCEVDATLACKQTDRSECRANCGDIITTSACTQVCTYVLQQQGQCKSQFEKFCKTQCVSKC
jgi:hypothetical protein